MNKKLNNNKNIVSTWKRTNKKIQKDINKLEKIWEILMIILSIN